MVMGIALMMMLKYVHVMMALLGQIVLYVSTYRLRLFTSRLRLRDSLCFIADVCPAGRAWADIASSTNVAHAAFTECSSMVSQCP